MSAIVISMADRQPQEVQRRAIAAVALQRTRDQRRPTLDEILGVSAQDRTTGLDSLDAWYRAQPVPKGKCGPKLHLTPDERRLYRIPATAALVDLRGMGPETDGWAVCVFPVLQGYVVGLKAPHGGGGVGVFFRKSYKASDYANRLSVEHGLPIVERYA
ncbi:hypothetical protein NPJ82_02620 [Sphingomonas sp. NY01]|uniref:hypothetical protein n=1 Tax=Sphingomonas sp. NY01 TaxID=2968057 RepID=UPI00315C801B